MEYFITFADIVSQRQSTGNLSVFISLITLWLGIFLQANDLGVNFDKTWSEEGRFV